MAKLSAHGMELLRVERELSIPSGDLTIWERKTRTYHSDGVVLEKLDVRFKPDQYDPQGRYYSYGWKRYGKVKDRANLSAVIDKMRSATEASEHWRVVTA